MPLNTDIAMGFRMPQIEGPLDQYSKVMTLKNMIEQNKQRQMQAQQAQLKAAQQAQYQQALQAAGDDPEKQIAVARRYGDPKDVMNFAAAHLDRQATREQTAFDRDATRDNQLQIAQAQIRGQIEVARANGASREQVAQMMIDGRREIARIAAGSKDNSLFAKPKIEDFTPESVRKYVQSRNPADLVSINAVAGAPDNTPNQSAIAPTVAGPSATGGSGFFQGMANTAADMFGQKMPYQATENATQALNNLQVQTVTLLQDAVPGRPSNYLLKKLESLAVQPGSLMMADQRAKERLSATRSMLKTEVERMKRDILDRPGNYTKAQLGKARGSYGQLQQLLSEYDTVINSFAGKGPTTSGAIRTAPPPGFTID